MRKASNEISALFEFTQNGALHAIYLNAQDEHDEAVLQRGLSRLLKPEKMGLVGRLFGMVGNAK